MSVGAGAIRAGLAVVELSADLGPLDAALNQAAARLKGFSGKIAKIGVGVAGAGLAIAGPIAGLFKGAVDQAASMGSLATQLSMTTEKASALAYALGTVGISEEELVGFTKHLNNKFAEAASNTGTARQEFAAFGVNIDELMKLPLDERLIAVSEALKNITTDFDRSNKATALFGRRGMELLKLPAGELQKRMKEAGDVGAVVTEEQAAQAKEVRRSWGQLSSSVKFAFLEIGRALLPHADQVRRYSAMVVNITRTIREWISRNKALVLGVLGLGVALTGAGAALVALGVIGASVAGVLSGAAAVAGAAWALLSSGIGLAGLGAAAALALIAGGAYLLATRTDAGRESMRRLQPVLRELGAEGKKAWGTISEAALEAWGGIVSAMKRGDLKSAWAIVVALAEVAWEQVKASFFSVWATVRDGFLDGWRDTAAALEMMFVNTVAAIGTMFARLMAKVADQLAALALRVGSIPGAGASGAALKALGGSLAGSGAGTEERIEAERRRRIKGVAEAAAEAKAERARARAEARAEHDDAVKAAKDKFKAVLDEEKKKDAEEKKRGGPGEGGPTGHTLQQAAREVRGSFGVGFAGSASAQQALAVGSTPVQRQLVEGVGKTNTILERIEDKIEPPAAFG